MNDDILRALSIAMVLFAMGCGVGAAAFGISFAIKADKNCAGEAR